MNSRPFTQRHQVLAVKFCSTTVNNHPDCGFVCSGQGKRLTLPKTPQFALFTMRSFVPGIVIVLSAALSAMGLDNVCGPPPDPLNSTVGASNVLIIGDSISMGCCWGSSTTEPIGYGLYVKGLFESEGLATVQVRELQLIRW